MPEILVELYLCRHFPQVRGGGVEGIGIVPDADFRAWFPQDKLDMDAARPLAEAFVAEHGDALRAGALVFHPGTIRGLMSAMLILEMARVPADKWEQQLICEPGLWTFNPGAYCFEDGSAPSMAEFFVLRPKFSRQEGERMYEVFEKMATSIAGSHDFSGEKVVAFGISHGGPLDLGFAEARIYDGKSRAYPDMENIGKGEIKKISFLVKHGLGVDAELDHVDN